VATNVDTLAAVARRHILGERANRYLRNTMVLSLIAVAIHFTSYVEFKTLSFFGVQLSKEAPSPRAIVLFVLWTLLAYSAAWTAYYIWLDWRRWRFDLTQRWSKSENNRFSLN
jgi:hypothetical protein